MITLAMAVKIEAPRTAVWEAITDPSQVPRWRPGVIAALDPTPLPPTAGHTRRWSFRLHDLPVVLAERALEVSPPSFLHCRQRLGLFDFDQALSLRPLGPDARRTRLALRISTPSHIPVVGGSLDRFAVQRFATTLAATTLEALRDWCERDLAASGAAAPKREVAAANA